MGRFSVRTQTPKCPNEHTNCINATVKEIQRSTLSKHRNGQRKKSCQCQPAQELLHTPFQSPGSNSVGCHARSMSSCRTPRSLVIRRRCRNVESDWKNVRSHAVLQTDLTSNSCSSAARTHAFQISDQSGAESRSDTVVSHHQLAPILFQNCTWHWPRHRWHTSRRMNVSLVAPPSRHCPCLAHPHQQSPSSASAVTRPAHGNLRVILKKMNVWGFSESTYTQQFHPVTPTSTHGQRVLSEVSRFHHTHWVTSDCLDLPVYGTCFFQDHFTSSNVQETTKARVSTHRRRHQTKPVRAHMIITTRVECNQVMQRYVSIPLRCDGTSRDGSSPCAHGPRHPQI